MARRSSDDPQWIETKKIIDKRDKRCCQFERCLSAKEFYQLQKGSPTTLDRAHIFGAAAHLELIYNPKNIITLRRFIHRRMDDYQNPLNGETIDIKEHFYWWYRIKNHKVADYDPEIDYELLLQQEIS